MNTQVYDAVTQIHLEVPTGNVWTMDNTFIRCYSDNVAYPISATVTLTDGGDTYTYTYDSEVSTLTFNLMPLIRQLPFNNTISYNLSATNANGTYTYSGAFVLLHGKTLNSRTHGSVRVLEYNESADLSSVEFYDHSTYGTTLTYYSGGVAQSVYNINPKIMVALNVDEGTDIELAYGGLSPYGDLWGIDKGLHKKIRLRKVCPQKNMLKLEWYDLDGCKRLSIGQVTNDIMKAEREEYTRGVTVEDVARSAVYGSTKEIKIGFTDVDPHEYLEDIMLSPTITTLFGLSTVELIPTTLTIDKDGSTKDITITFKIN